MEVVWTKPSRAHPTNLSRCETEDNLPAVYLFHATWLAARRTKLSRLTEKIPRNQLKSSSPSLQIQNALFVTCILNLKADQRLPFPSCVEGEDHHVLQGTHSLQSMEMAGGCSEGHRRCRCWRQTWDSLWSSISECLTTDAHLVSVNYSSGFRPEHPDSSGASVQTHHPWPFSSLTGETRPDEKAPLGFVKNLF